MEMPLGAACQSRGTGEAGRLERIDLRPREGLSDANDQGHAQQNGSGEPKAILRAHHLNLVSMEVISCP